MGADGQPPEPVLDCLTSLFQQLGPAREHDDCSEGLAAVLDQAGLPALVLSATGQEPDPAALIATHQTVTSVYYSGLTRKQTRGEPSCCDLRMG